MARDKKIEVGALNIKMHPHPPGSYVSLFQMAFDQRLYSGVYGDSMGMIGSFAPVDEDRHIYSGEIYRFLHIDPNDPWLNLQTRQAIADENGDPIPQVPDYLRPNLRKVMFALVPGKHRFLFDRQGISPKSAVNFLKGLFVQKPCVKAFGEIDVEMETSAEGIDKILRIPRIKTLEISVTRPNADDTDSVRNRIMNRLDAQGVRRMDVVLSSGRGGDAIRPDDKTKKLMDVASSDGKVWATGYGADDIPITESTDRHPLLDTSYYDPDRDTAVGAFLNGVGNLMRTIRSRER